MKEERRRVVTRRESKRPSRGRREVEMAFAMTNLKTKKSKVFLVDDHPIVRKGLAGLINQELGLVICGEAEDGPTALNAIFYEKPDIAIVDLSLKGMDGIELIKQIKARYPKLPVLVLSMLDEQMYAERVLRAGAKGYVMKQEGTEKLVTAIRRVLKGEVSISQDLSEKMLKIMTGDPIKKNPHPVERLSDRELEVFRLIGQGVGTRLIAERLSLSIKTVETYREHIKEKLMIKSAPELIKHAVDWVRSETSA